MFSMTALRKCALCILALVFLVNVRVALGANPDIPAMDVPRAPAESTEEQKTIEYSLFPKAAPGCEVVVREAPGMRTIHTKDGAKIITLFLGNDDEVIAVEIGEQYAAASYADDGSGRPVGFVTRDGVVHGFNTSPNAYARGAHAAKALVQKLAGKVCSHAKGLLSPDGTDMSDWLTQDFWDGIWQVDQLNGFNDWFSAYSTLPDYATRTCQDQINDCLTSCDWRAVGEGVLCGVAGVAAGTVTAGFGAGVGIVCAGAVGAARASCADQCRRMC